MTVHTYPGDLTSSQARAFTSANQRHLGGLVIRSNGSRDPGSAVTAALLELGFPLPEIRRSAHPVEHLACWLKAHHIRHVGFHGGDDTSPAALDSLASAARLAGADLWVSGVRRDDAEPCTAADLANLPDLLGYTGFQGNEQSWNDEVRRFRVKEHGVVIPLLAAVAWSGDDTCLLQRLVDHAVSLGLHAPHEAAVRLHADITASSPARQKLHADLARLARHLDPWVAATVPLAAVGLPCATLAGLGRRDYAPDGRWVNVDSFRVSTPTDARAPIRALLAWLALPAPAGGTAVSRRRSELSIATHARAALCAAGYYALAEAVR